MVQASSSATGTSKSRTAEAIRLAVEGNWKAAAATNESILKDFSQDVDAANRLGKAYSELNKARKAIKAYELALEIDKFNQIARRNLERLQNTPATSGKGKKLKAKKTTTKAKKVIQKNPSHHQAWYLLQRLLTFHYNISMWMPLKI